MMHVPNERKILAAAEAGKTHELDMELGRLRHVTGLIKARAVASAVKEEFENGLEKIVLAYWHRDVGDVLETLLQPHGVVRLDGSTLPHAREQVEKRFRSPANKVFLVQIEAGCEAIDLSPVSYTHLSGADAYFDLERRCRLGAINIPRWIVPHQVESTRPIEFVFLGDGSARLPFGGDCDLRFLGLGGEA